MLGQFEDVSIVAEAGDIPTALNSIRHFKPDAVFLDVELTNGTGFDIARDLPPDTFIIIVSAYDLYAIDAFNVAALDYLLKPVEPQRLETAINRLRERTTSPDGYTERAEESMLLDGAGRIRLKTNSTTILVQAETISMLKADGDYTRIFLETGQTHLISKLLRKFEPELPNPPFFRLSRSHIVNKGHIRKVERYAANKSRLYFETCSETVELGRSATRRLREILNI